MLSSGWTRRAYAFFAGAFGAAALAPINFIPAIAISLIVAVWLLDGAAPAEARKSSRRGIFWPAFATGWMWGFGYFLFGLWWVGSAFLVEAENFAWALPLGVIALPATLALFPAIGFALARLFWTAGYRRILIFALSIFLTEWMRCLVATGFPWNEIGMAFGGQLVLAQLASLIGLHGLTLTVVALLAAPATLTDCAPGQLRLRPTILSLLILAGIIGFGAYRISRPEFANVPGVKLRIMQPVVAQGAYFSSKNGADILRGYLELSDRSTSPTSSGIGDVTHLIWPESAFPFLLAQEAAVIQQISKFLHGGATLITGAARVDEGDSRRYYNSIQVVDSHGVLAERYDKKHLVPFGEYLPFARFITRFPIAQFVHIPGGFDSGAAKQDLLHIAGLPPAEPLICYEAIFPRDVGSLWRAQSERPAWILNVTDDAWFGLTAGPYQHFEQARLRAIEQGLPLVRAANSGISAITDGYGRIRSQLPLGARDVIDGKLPEMAPEPLFSQFGALAPGGLALAILLALLSSAFLTHRKYRS